MASIRLFMYAAAACAPAKSKERETVRYDEKKHINDRKTRNAGSLPVIALY